MNLFAMASGNQPAPAAPLCSLFNHVEHLAGGIGERNIFRPNALADARNYIAGEWDRQGYEVASHWYETRGLRCANLEVTRIGRKYPEQILLIGAHYDSVIGSPGANDNASGVAALLELSRLFTTGSPATSIRFVAFVNEEPPFFMSRKLGRDHLSFWRLGYPALMVTDTAFYRYPYYHSAEDTPEKLAYPQLAQVAEGLFRALSAVSESGFG